MTDNVATWETERPEFEAALAALDPPTTWVQLARMHRADRFPTPEHRAVFDTWREWYSRQLTGNVGPRTTRPSQVSPCFKGPKR